MKEKSILQASCFALQKPCEEEYICNYKLFASFYCIISLIQCCPLNLNEQLQILGTNCHINV